MFRSIPTSVPPALVAFKDVLKSRTPVDQAIPYFADTWWVGFPNDPDFSQVHGAHQGEISRKHLFDQAHNCFVNRQTSGDRQLFLASMIWGYGTVGYGAYRSRLMLDTPDASRTIGNTLDLLAAGKISLAYDGFNLNRCGSAFFTKFFYFAGQGCPTSQSPLIFDSRVATSLKRLLGREFDRKSGFGGLSPLLGPHAFLG